MSPKIGKMPLFDISSEADSAVWQLDTLTKTFYRAGNNFGKRWSMPLIYD